MGKPPKVVIVILNWNGFEETIECVDSISRIEYSNYKILIVDNGSDSNEIDNIVLQFPFVKIIKSKENLGFSGGNNLGIEYAIKLNADFILLLNNDTIVEPNFLGILVHHSTQNINVGILVPKINYYINQNRIWYAGGYISKFRGSGFTIGQDESGEKYSNNKYVTFATGCCLLIKMEVIKKIGLMDPQYFLYLEDVDYCLRNNLKGYKILYIGKSKIYHKVSISSNKQNNLASLYYVTRNRFYFAKKFYPNFYYIPFLYITIIFFIKILYWFISGENEKIKIAKKAISDYIFNKMGKSEDL